MSARRPTLSDIAREAGVSAALVSYALNGTGRVAPAMSEQIARIAREMGYQTNGNALALRTGRGTGLGFVIRNLKNPFFLDVLDAISPHAESSNRMLSIMDSRYRLDRQDEILDALDRAGTTAALVSAVGGEQPLLDWQRRTGSSMRLVTLNVAPSEDMDAPTLSSVNLDHRSSIEQTVAHLAATGHERATLIAAPAPQESDQLRISSWAQACPRHAIDGSVLRSPLDYDTVLARCSRLMTEDRRDLALVFSSDHLATAAYEAAHLTGRRIGEDVSIIGHDDLATSRLLTPGLTTLTFSRERLAAGIMRALESVDPVHVTVPVTLVERGSVARRSA